MPSKRKIFLDTNVVIDFLINRKPFSINAAKIFDLSLKKELIICISSLSVNNINYIVGRLESKEKAKDLIKQLLPLVDILPVGNSVVQKSLKSTFKDFEDGLQNFCAEEGNITTLITRDIKDYSASTLAIQTPSDFLASIETPSDKK